MRLCPQGPPHHQHDLIVPLVYDFGCFVSKTSLIQTIFHLKPSAEMLGGIPWRKITEISYYRFMGFPGGSRGKESACNVGDLRSIPGSEEPWRREWQPTPVFLPGKSHGQRSLAG